MRSKYYDIVPISHTCKKCNKNRDHTTFGITLAGKIKKLCNSCNTIIYGPTYTKPNKQQRQEMISYRIREYFKQEYKCTN